MEPVGVSSIRCRTQIVADAIEKDLAATIEVDGQPFTIKGRIDRIDRHDEFGYRIADYKTGDAGKSPDKTHVYAGEWVDLQLPLYRGLVRTIGIDDSDVNIALGYINLAKKARDTGWCEAEWDATMLAAAMQAHLESPDTTGVCDTAEGTFLFPSIRR